ncbi:MAG: MotA/TolQ/ExbB proton channel family protein [Trinickia sp.]|uniref:MotA/TolQ/ExbB proton channel family protein n=1 Tax=Trinickia sp. TaxID=2571163 RepID=UPI003F7E5D20
MDALMRFAQLSELSLGIIPILAFMLAIVLAVTVERVVFFRRAAPAARMLERTLPTVDMRHEALLRQLAARFRPSIFGGTLQAVVEASHLADADSMDRYIDEAIMRTLPSLDRSLWLLDAAATLGPLIGLLGGIVGIGESLNVLSAAGPNVQAITGGVGHALTAVGCGLAVAIVGAAANSYLSKRVSTCMQQLELLKLACIRRLCLSARSGTAAENNGPDGQASALYAIKRTSNGSKSGA